METSAKTHKFENFDDINIKELKLRPIIDQTGTCYYKTGKVIAQYLKPLTNNEFVINSTQDFPSMLNTVELSEDEDVSYDVESLFTNIPINKTIDFICDEIYIHKKLQPICKRSIFQKLLLKLTTEYTFSVNEQLFKQIDVFSMGGTLSVVLSDYFMNKMEKDAVIPFKPKFYKRFVDDIYRRRKRNEPDELFDKIIVIRNRLSFCYVEIYRAAQNTGDDVKKNIAFLEGNKLFAGDFVLIWMKQTLIWFIYKEIELEMACLTLRRLSQKVCSYKCQFCTSV